MFTSIEKKLGVNIVIITQKNTRIISKNIKLSRFGVAFLTTGKKKWLIEFTILTKVSGCNQFILNKCI